MKKYSIQPKGKRVNVCAGSSPLLRSSALSTRQVRFVAVAMISAAMPYAAFAQVVDPSTFVNESGSTNSTRIDTTHLLTEQFTHSAIISAPSIDLPENNFWTILQPSTSSVLLVRVTNGQPSQILGTINANGQLVISNGAGVYFGRNSQVNVAGLIATTADISNTNFNAGRYKFDRPGNPNASIINHGTITAKQGGLVALLAPGVVNDGVISAELGTVAIGAGEAFTVDFYGDNLFSFSVDKKATAAGKDENGNDLKDAINNSGSIKAGRILMTADSAKGVVDHAINLSGIVEATNAHMDGGDIVLDGGQGNVRIAGTVKASGKKGGNITVTGEDNITLASTARIDASGETTGGTIRIGGDKRGKGTLARAKTLDVDSGAVIDASGKTGKGGDVVLWSDLNTDFNGFINVSSQADKGGDAEVSSKLTLAYRGFTDATGTEFGTLLLDPGNWTISGAASDGNNYNNTDLATQLNSANVSIDTFFAAAQPGHLGDINVNADVNWSGKGNLSLTAENNVNINAKITSTYTNAGKANEGALFVNALKNINVNKTITTNTGSINLGSGGKLSLNDAQLNTKSSVSIGAGEFYSSTKNAINAASVDMNQTDLGSIQNAIDAIGNVTGKSILRLSDGIYNENVTIDVSNFSLLSLNGANVTKIVGVAGKGQTGTITVANGANNVTIGGRNDAVFFLDHGFTISGVDNGKSSIANAAINFLGNNGGSQVESNFINSTGKNVSGILISNNNNAPGNGIMIGGLLPNSANNISGVSGDGIRVLNSANVTISRNNISDTTGAGVISVNSNNMVVDRNNFSKIGSKTSGAIAIQGGSAATITNNIINGTGRNGIQLSQTTGKSLIDGNTVNGTAVFGILTNLVAGAADGSEGVTISNNTVGNISGNGSGSGIANIGSAYATITNNTVSNYHGGININSKAIGNVISNNTVNLRPNGTGIIVDTESNNSRLVNNTINGALGSVGISIARSNGVSSTNDRSLNNQVGIRIDNAQNTSVTGGTLDGNTLGMYVLGGSSNTQVGSTSFSNGTLGMYIQDAGSSAGFSDNGSTFTNLAGFFQLGRDAMVGQTLDASQQTFNGVRGQDLNFFEFADARSKTIDSLTVPTVGFVFYRNQPPAPAGISQQLLNQLLINRETVPLQDIFSYSGKTLEANYALSPYNFQVQALNLSLLAPAAGGQASSGTSLGNLSPAAGPNSEPASGTNLASLEPAAGGDAGIACGNNFLSDGLSDGNCQPVQ